MDYTKKLSKKNLILIISGSLVLLVVFVFLIMNARGKDNPVSGEYKEPESASAIISHEIIDIADNVLHPTEPTFVPPPPPDMERMKTQGCITDGMLNGYRTGTSKAIKMINRSECYYLHRAIESWLEPPDFDDIRKNMAKIEKDEIVYGMFIAEAISTKSDLYYIFDDRDFKFSKMCRPDSKNFWGEHTCKPYFERSEYRRYLRYITQEAMDLGVQSFIFGQIYHQENIDEPVIPEIIEEMRAYADLKGMEIVIGAQTNDITDEEYLRNFDFIEGGVGLSANGTVENGPCFSRWWNPQDGGWCWALLWHDSYKTKARNVFVHLDWNGKRGDDMSTFTLMDKKQRAETLTNLYNYFESQNVGFLMPMLATLPKDNGGCKGPMKRLYSADNRYTCQDEDVINELMKED